MSILMHPVDIKRQIPGITVSAADCNAGCLVEKRIFGFGFRIQIVCSVRYALYPYGWWHSPAVEHRSLADVLSLSCARLVADG